MKLLFILSFLFFYNCTFHYFKMNNDPIEIKDLKRIDQKLKIQLKRTANETTNRSDRDVIESYNSVNLIKYIEDGCCILIDDKSQLILKYETKVQTESKFPILILVSLATLGIFPIFEETDTSVSVEIQNPETGNTYKTINYKIKDNIYNTWLAPIVYSFFILSDSADLSFLHSGYDYPQKFIANRIDKDLILDIEKLKSANTQPERNLQDKKNIAIMPVIFHLSRDQNLANVLQDKMETIFIEKKFTVLERKEINQAINEVKMSQTGLTEEKQNQLGKMLNATNLIISEILRIQETGNTIDFSVKNLDVQTGKILWKYEFQLDDKDLSHTVNESMKSLKENIK